MLLVHAGQTGYAGAYPAYPIAPPLDLSVRIDRSFQHISFKHMSANVSYIDEVANAEGIYGTINRF